METTPRRSMSPQRRLRIFEAHKGVCVLCSKPIDGVRDKWTIEHMRALGLGGEDDDKNCGPAHEACRRVKDKEDVSSIAKAKRVKARHVGAKKPTGKLQGPGFPKHEKRKALSSALPALPRRNPYNREAIQ